MLSIVLKIGVVIVPRIRILDAGTEEYQEEEEEVYPQGEEDHFDQYTNQGKLIFLQGAKLYQSKAHWSITFCLMILSQVFTLQALLEFNYQSYFLIYYSLGLDIE